MNSRGMQEEWILQGIFPPPFAAEKKIHQQPASENETRALIRIFQEYGGRGLLVFCGYGKKVVYYRRDQNFSTGQRCYRLARHLKKMYQGKAGAACNRTRSAERAKEHRQAGTVLRRNDPPAGFPDRIAGKFRK